MTQDNIKQTLIDLQAKLEERLAAVQRDLQKEHSKDWEEQAQERENDEVLEALQTELTQELNQIKTALLKIENGDYGVCSGCGEDIASERLKVLPDADLCINCANAA
ncbi:MAG: TraR/DksA C4-type zinc finger protein [Candidatus Pelagadaptatus aseana]|uniref:TraR/DksA family transcriptional regulator n=1 Tax=Candidatus Pelagadaptatus aseana TaxID=3120508 RepID=UPI0039B17843